MASQNIAFVAQQGDLVDDGSSSYQWANATAAMYQLDGKVPWGTCAGDGEYSGDPTTANYIARFGPSHFAAPTYPAGVPSWYGGYYAGDSGRDSYQTFAANGRQYLVLDR